MFGVLLWADMILDLSYYWRPVSSPNLGDKVPWFFQNLTQPHVPNQLCKRNMADNQVSIFGRVIVLSGQEINWQQD